MAYQVLARKYRPQLFSDVIGQDHVTRTLLNALAQNRIAHGYIFSGHRGIGKTTIARILAAALNCSTEVGTAARPTHEPCRICVNCREISSASRQENSIFEESHSFDVEEIDAATNRGIDDARLLTTKIQTRPTNKSKYRIIILDEAHQITDAAWNALLKTLEEPPEWAVFMFATTQPEDIPQTIRSRCQHFSFHAVKLDDIVRQLRFIATKEAIDVDDETLTLLAEAGDGSMRDALSIMDQAIASAPLIPTPASPAQLSPSAQDLPPSAQDPGAPCLASETWDSTIPREAPAPNALTLATPQVGAPFVTASSSRVGSMNGTEQLRPHLTAAQVRELMGSVSNTVFEQILEAVHANNSADVLSIVGRLLDAGNGAPQLARQFVRYLRNTIVAKVTNLTPGAEATGAAADLLQISSEERSRAARSAALFTEEELSRFLAIVLRTFDELGYRQEQRFHLELGLLKLVHLQRLVPIEEVLSQLGAKPASNPVTTPSNLSSRPEAAVAAAVERPTVSPPNVPQRPPSAQDPEAASFAAAVERPAAPRANPTQPASPSSSKAEATTTMGAPCLDSETWDTTTPRKPTTPNTPSSSKVGWTDGSLALAEAPHPTATPADLPPQPNSRPHLVVPSTDPAPIHTPAIHAEAISASPILGATDPTPPDQARIHAALIAALAAAKGQQSASEQIEDATLNINGTVLEIQTSLSRTMLPVVLNAEAERIMKAALREANAASLTLKLLPGTPAASSAPKQPRAALSGSAAELAEKHPIVQEARRLFSADISNVIDLRVKS